MRLYAQCIAGLRVWPGTLPGTNPGALPPAQGRVGSGNLAESSLRWSQRCNHTLSLAQAPESTITNAHTIIAANPAGACPRYQSRDLPNHRAEEHVPGTMALCQPGWWLTQQLLAVTAQLKQQPCGLSELAFLNYFSWQRTGQSLLTPVANAPPPNSASEPT